MKVVVAVYGCLNRSFHITGTNHIDKIFKPLETNRVEYDMLFVNNHVEKIDSTNVNHRDKIWDKFTRTARVVTYEQQHALNELNNTHDVSELFDVSWYNTAVKRRAALNSYLETRTARELSKYDHDKAIVFCSDLWFDREFNIDWLEENNIIIVGDQNNGSSGMTNGFYCGDTQHISQLLDTFYDLHGLSRRSDYERMLRYNAERHDISYESIPYRFLKIRANGDVAYKTTEKFMKDNPGAHRTKLWNKIRHIVSAYRKEVA